MAISSINNNTYPGASAILSSYINGATSSASDTVNREEPGKALGDNNSELALAVRQTLTQINSAKDISVFLSSKDSQESGTDFTSNLFSTLPGLGNTANSTDANTTVKPIVLDQSSSSYKLQESIQKLITQLDSSGSAGENAGLGKLQDSFNTLIKNSGGDPSAANLQSFLKLVAVNVQGSTSIGSLFNTSA